MNLDRSDYVNETEKVRFFYFAHHADSIEIYGQPRVLKPINTGYRQME